MSTHALTRHYQIFSSNRTLRSRVVSTIISGLLVLAAVYIYAVGSITFSIVERKALEQKSATLAATINSLELAYLEKVESLDRNSAHAAGFVEPKQVYFAERAQGSHFSYLNDGR